MLMLCHSAPRKTAAAICSLAASVAIAGVLAGCAAENGVQLPGTHLDQTGEVAASHGRCGACHSGGTRGNGSYIILDYGSMESLPLSEFDMEAPPVDVNVPESLYFELIPEEGAE